MSCLIIVLVAVDLATPFFLDINCTPLEELVDEIITGGSEAGEIDAMAQDEEANGHTEAAGTTRTYKIHEIFELPYCFS